MKIGYFSRDGIPFIGVVVDGRVLDLTGASWHGDHPFLQNLSALVKTENFNVRIFQSLYDEGKDRDDLWHDIESLSFLPLYRPGKIICMGLNYAGHAEETGRAKPEEPIFFEKASSAVIAHGEAIMYPGNLGRIDPEAELAVIIGKEAENVKEGDARDYICGYTCLNDVTARDMQARDMERRQPWYRSKSINTFCPIGPWITTSEEIDPVEPLRVQLRVNGEVRQDAMTSQLIFNIPALIAHISSIITLQAGDIISTGTPEGIAPVYPGDVVEVDVQKIGVLRNLVAKSGR